jgi:hypothetical protein
MWIVMTSSAQMPSKCWGQYRRVALVQLTQEYTAKDWRPKMLSVRARGVVRLIDYGHHNVGLTERCAYRRTLKEAEARAKELNTVPEITPDMLISYVSA